MWPMPERIRLNHQQRSIELQAYGIVSQEEIAGSLGKVQRILKETGIYNIFVDATEQKNMRSTMCMFEFFKSFTSKFRVSLLIPKKQTAARNYSIAENVGLHRGVLIKIFHDRERALQWLENG